MRFTIRRDTVTAVVATVAVAVTAGCSTGGAAPTAAPSVLPSSASLTVNGIDLEPQLDEATGAVILPLDRFEPTWEESNTLTVAGSVALALCARERGVTVVAPELIRDPVYLSESYYGPWTVAQAERFAFVQPMSDADLAANGIVGAADAPESEAFAESNPNLLLTDEDWVTVDDCGASDGTQKFATATQLTGPWTEQVEAARAALLDNDEAVALLDELGACFTSRGMEPDPDAPWTVLGDSYEISEQQVTLALGVVECKNETGFTEQMARLEARVTIPALSEYIEELTERRQEIDAALEEARALIAAHDDVIRHTA